MLVSRETGPLYCSEGADFTKHFECVRMVGYSIQKKYLWADKKVTNHWLP